MAKLDNKIDQLLIENIGKTISWSEVREKTKTKTYHSARELVRAVQKRLENILVKIDQFDGVTITKKLNVNEFMTWGYSERPNATGNLFPKTFN